jgi:hypothetical protein
MLDMRYHVISLVAVFLALGIGILLGTTLVERGLIAEQKTQIRSLRRTFDEIEEKNDRLNDQLSAYVEYADESRAYLLPGRLADKRFAVLAGGSPEDDALAGIYESINASGGSVPLTITVLGSDAYKDETVLANLRTLFGIEGDEATLRTRVFQELVNQLATASNAGILSTLDQLGVIQVKGALDAPFSAAVLLGALEPDGLDQVDVPLIRQFVATPFPLVGTTGSEAPDFVLLTYKKNGISTVDHVDSSPGEVALSMVLEGRGGNYGSGKAAGRMLPEQSGL